MEQVTKVRHHPLQVFPSWIGKGVSALLVFYGTIGVAQGRGPQKAGVLLDAPQQRSL